MRWLGGLEASPTLDVASVSEARDRVREVGQAQRLPEVAIASLVTVASELAQNHLRHAQRGAIAVRAVDGPAGAGVEVVAVDEGPGIALPARALTGGASSVGGLGIGLAAVFELADEVDVDVRLDEGTCVRARKFAARPETRSRQLGVFGRALAGEPVSGDDAAFVRRPDGRLLLFLADGLGHGPEARQAASAAIDGALRDPDASPDASMEAAHLAAKGTRGAVMTIVELTPCGEITVASVGNTTAQLVRRGSPHRFAGASWVIGQPARPPAVRVERAVVAPTEAVVIFSDGLSSKLGFDSSADLLQEPPIVMAQRLLDRYAKPHDDALVLVAR
jgi:anti-sigma regulatory factor (Ser/Thr protein kinase)